MQIAFWITLTPWTRPSSSTDKRELLHPLRHSRIIPTNSLSSVLSFFCFSFHIFLSLSFSHRFPAVTRAVYDISTLFSTTRTAFVTLLVTPPDLLAADGIIFLILYTCTAKPTRADKSLLEENCRCAAFTIFASFFRCSTRLRIYIDYLRYLSNKYYIGVIFAKIYIGKMLWNY